MKRIITIISVALYTMICTSLFANDITNVTITANEEMFSIYALGKGNGAALDDAKLAAYNDMLQQLFTKTQSFPFPLKGGINKYVWESNSPNGSKKAMGADAILAKTHIAGRWELVDGVYYYTLKLLVENLDKNEKE